MLSVVHVDNKMHVAVTQRHVNDVAAKTEQSRSRGNDTHLMSQGSDARKPGTTAGTTTVATTSTARHKGRDRLQARHGNGAQT